jgi:hypothetical protein
MQAMSKLTGTGKGKPVDKKAEGTPLANDLKLNAVEVSMAGIRAESCNSKLKAKERQRARALQ